MHSGDGPPKDLKQNADGGFICLPVCLSVTLY
jgi:hypothetical protein